VHLLAFGNTRSSGPWRHPDIDDSTAGVRRRLIGHAQTAEDVESLTTPAALSSRHRTHRPRRDRIRHAADNLSARGVVDHDERYRIADEAIDVVKKLWDSRGEGTIVEDRAAGIFHDVSKIHVPDHHGTHFPTPERLRRTIHASTRRASSVTG
jgi:hypothetical protein